MYTTLILDPLLYRIDPSVGAYLREYRNITLCNIVPLMGACAIQAYVRWPDVWWTITLNGAIHRVNGTLHIPYKLGPYCHGAITEADFVTEEKRA